MRHKMNKMMRTLPLLLTGIVTLFIVGLAHHTYSYAAPPPQPKIACKDGSLLGIPTWYQYLHCDTTTGKRDFTNKGGVYNPQDVLLIVMAIISILMYLAGILAAVFIIVGGIKYITSQGNPEGVQNAKNTIIYAVTGLILTILASGVVSFIARSVVSK